MSIHVEDELKAELQGAGDLSYKGKPRIESLSVTGTGKLKSIDHAS